jgi:hypothetical protein
MSRMATYTRSATAPLTLMFCGVLLTMADVRIDVVDLLPDAVGLTLLAFGLAGLLPWSAGPATRRRLRMATCLTVATIPLGLLDDAGASGVVWPLTGAVHVGALVVTCLAMESLCRETRLAKSYLTWRPLRWATVALAVTTAVGTFTHVLALLTIVLLIITWLWFPFAIWRTRAEIV